MSRVRQSQARGTDRSDTALQDGGYEDHRPCDASPASHLQSRPARGLPIAVMRGVHDRHVASPHDRFGRRLHTLHDIKRRLA